MKLNKIALGCCIALLSTSMAFAQVSLPRLIRDSMILQRDKPVKIWGWATKNEKVKITFNHKIYKTVAANADGKWNVILPATKAGGPYNMTIASSNSITLKDILFGDVWICSGQSNMVHQMELHSVRYEEEIAKANNPEIRHFWIPTLTDLQKPREDLPTGYWKSVNPKDVLQFSAIAYFFDRKIYEQYHVPIGLINASVGGSPIEAWISEEGLKDFTSIQSTVQKNKDTAYINSFGRRSLTAKPGIRHEDNGLLNKWYATNYIPKGWHTINVPGYWEDQGVKDLDGVVWYRKEF